jgi:hypothetical protein
MIWLEDFAYFPRALAAGDKDYLTYIADFALKENWGDRLRYLERYVDSNFQLAYEQGLVQEAPDKSYALWRVGNLVSRDNEPISILCTRNRTAGARQPYYFTRVFNSRRFDIIVEGQRTTVNAPDPPKYQVPPYHPEYDLTYRFDHYLRDNKERAEQTFPTLNDNQRFLCIYAAAQLAHRRGSQAVPQWYRDKRADRGSYQWLLPLFINEDDISQKPDLVATLDPDDAHREYRIRTLLPPEWAYPHARAISGHDPQFRTWA